MIFSGVARFTISQDKKRRILLQNEENEKIKSQCHMRNLVKGKILMRKTHQNAGRFDI